MHSNRFAFRGSKTMLLATVSALATFAADAIAQQTGNPVEEVLVTGSLIRGASVVGVPVTSLGQEDFSKTGAIIVSDLLKSTPGLSITPSLSPTAIGGNGTRSARIDLHSLNALNASERTLVLIDGVRFPYGGGIGENSDPSFLPQLAVERIDVVATGASATYGSDAVAGVVNVILKRNFDGAKTQISAKTPSGGGFQWSISQLFGRSWQSGNITLAFTHYDINALPGSARPDILTQDFRPWGLDDNSQLKASIPGVVSTGAPTPTTAVIGTGCTNCFSVPKGQGPTGLTWATLLANAGVKNEINAFSIADAIPPQHSNAISGTFDQDVFPGVHFFGDAYYSNRRGAQIVSATVSPAAQGTIFTLTVPTGNPFYPIGAPPGLRVSYHFGVELPPTVSFFEVSSRYAAGLQFELPRDWQGKLHAATSSDSGGFVTSNVPNANNITAALGGTTAVVAASGSTPAIAAFTKPANVPYLNLFCDPTAFSAYTCNSKTTLDYISGTRLVKAHSITNQFDIVADGPVVTLAGGDVRAAIGGSLIRANYYNTQINSINAPAVSLPVNVGSGAATSRVYAFFGEVHIPIFSEKNAIPLFRKLEIQLSERYDHYDQFGSTTNPRVAVDWVPIDGLTLRGAWDSSFRAPTFSDLAATNQIRPINASVGATNTFPTCVGTTATPGSFGATLNPTCASDTASLFPGGITVEGSAIFYGSLFNRSPLTPEKSKDYSLGFEYAPTDNFLKGLDIDVTYWNVNIDGILTALNARNVSMTDPAYSFLFLSPANTPDFAAKVATILADAGATGFSAGAASNVKFILDGLTRNAGSFKTDGVDFRANYDWSMPGFGDWNVGGTGTYYLHRTTTVTATAPPIDSLNMPNQPAFVNGVATVVNGQTQITPPQSPRFRYRAHVGWSMDNIDVTAFVNYRSHFFTPGSLPPTAVLLASGITNYANVVAPYYTFDLSVSYDLGDQPANEYLKGLKFDFVVNNILDRKPPFSYQNNVAGPGVVAYVGGVDTLVQREFAFTVTKTW